MRADILAGEVARRLNATEVARFSVSGNRVVLGADGAPPDYQVPIEVIDVGAGRREQVRGALARATTGNVPVLVGRHFTPGVLEELNALGVNYMDDRHLFVRMETPSIVVRLKDDSEPLPDPATDGRVTLSGVAGGVALALLQDRTKQWTITEVAEAAKASLGMAQNTVVALEGLGLVERAGKGPATRRRLLDPAALLDLYARDAVADRKVIGRGFLLNDGAEATMRAAVRNARKHSPPLGIWFTGMAAAQVEAPHVSAVNHFEFWVTTPHRIDVILDAVGSIRADDGANLTVLRGPRAVRVGGVPGRVQRVSLCRMYADLLQDPARGEEQAEFLRETRIKF